MCNHICSSLLLLFIIGYPRFYHTNIPISLFFIPFYFVGFCRECLARNIVTFFYVLIFFLWFSWGTVSFLYGDGNTSDLIFHVSIAVKILFNVFFGYVVYSILKKYPSSILYWLLFQFIIIAFSISSEKFYIFLTSFISPSSAAVFKYIYGLRSIGFGLYHVDGAILVVMMVFLYVSIFNKSLLQYLCVLFAFPMSMTLARSAIVPYVVFSSLRKGRSLKVLILLSFVVMFYISYFASSGAFYQATEIFRNLLFDSELHSESISAMSAMYHLPNEILTYMFGDGLYFDNNSDSLRFYMESDVGYIRMLYFSGVPYVLLFLCLNLYFSLFVLFGSSLYVNSDWRFYSLALIVVFLVINFKGLQVMPLFSIVVYLWCSAWRTKSFRKCLHPVGIDT